MSPTTRVLLGSASPARRGVLRSAGIDPLVLVADLDEDGLIADLPRLLPDRAITPELTVVELARAKGEAIVEQVLASTDPAIAAVAADGVILTCDSMLLVDGELAGKPKTPDVARARWRRMRGNSGDLLTGHCVIRMSDGQVVATAAAAKSTVVRFSDVSDAVIDRYVATGEPLEVAGAFTLDGLGGWLLDGIDGDPSSVIGISLPLTRELLNEVDVDVTRLWR